MTLRLAVLLSLVCSSTALAAPARKSDADADEAARRSGPAATKEYDFENDFVDGESLKPDHESIQSRPRHGMPSLIQIRPHFIPQLLHMAQDV